MGSRRDYHDRDYYDPDIHPSISTPPNLLTIALGPGDCVCTDFADPRRLSGCNLPPELTKLIADLLAERPDDFLDLDNDSDAPPTPRERSSDRDSDSTSRRRTRRRSNSDKERGASTTSNRKVGEREDIIIRRDNRTANDAHDLKASSQQVEISSLVFGSRYGEFGIVYCDRGLYYLDGRVFDRLSHLRDWIVPKYPRNKSINRAPLNERDGASLRLFLGPESSYFAYDASTREFITNIQDRDFCDWLLLDCAGILDTPPNEKTTLKPDYLPHSFTMGPNDMWCWICKEDYKSNSAFQQAFPAIELFLKFAKRKRILDQVMLTVSPDAQPGSKRPYFVLSTSEGVCVSSVPADATDLMSKASIRWGVTSSVQRTREIRHLKQESRVANDKLATLRGKLSEASGLTDAGIPSPASRRDSWDGQLDRLIAGLRQINDFCNLNAPTTDEYAARWAEASLANRVYMLFERFGAQTINSDPLDAAESARMSRDRTTLNLLQERVAKAELLLVQRSNDKPTVEGYPKPVDEMGYILNEINLITGFVNENAFSSDEWDAANLRTQIALILKNKPSRDNSTLNLMKEATAAAQSLLIQRSNDKPRETGYPDPYDGIKYVVSELQLIEDFVDKNATSDEEWNTANLRTQIALILNDRREHAKPSTNGASKDTSSLGDQIISALRLVDPGSRIPRDPSYGEHMTTIVNELQEVKAEINNVPWGGLEWIETPLASKVKYIMRKQEANGTEEGSDAEMELKDLKDGLTTIIGRLHAEMDKLEATEFKDRVLDLLKKVLEGDEAKVPSNRNDEDLVDYDA